LNVKFQVLTCPFILGVWEQSGSKLGSWNNCGLLYKVIINLSSGLGIEIIIIGRTIGDNLFSQTLFSSDPLYWLTKILHRPVGPPIVLLCWFVHQNCIKNKHMTMWILLVNINHLESCFKHSNCFLKAS